MINGNDLRVRRDPVFRQYGDPVFRSHGIRRQRHQRPEKDPVCVCDAVYAGDLFHDLCSTPRQHAHAHVAEPGGQDQRGIAQHLYRRTRRQSGLRNHSAADGAEQQGLYPSAHVAGIYDHSDNSGRRRLRGQYRDGCRMPRTNPAAAETRAVE